MKGRDFVVPKASRLKLPQLRTLDAEGRRRRKKYSPVNDISRLPQRRYALSVSVQEVTPDSSTSPRGVNTLRYAYEPSSKIHEKNPAHISLQDALLWISADRDADLSAIPTQRRTKLAYYTPRYNPLRCSEDLTARVSPVPLYPKRAEKHKPTGRLLRPCYLA